MLITCTISSGSHILTFYENTEDSLLNLRDPAIVDNSRGRPRRGAKNKKLKVPRYLKIVSDGVEPGHDDADDTDDDDAAADRAQPARRMQTRSAARGSGRRRRLTQAGRGTRPLNASLRRDRSQFEVDELQAAEATALSRGNRHQRARRRGTPRRLTTVASREFRASSEATQDCIIIPTIQ